MTQQSVNLLLEWNASVVSMLNFSYALDSSRCKQVAEAFNGDTYSRIHRRTDDTLILEERERGSMYPSVWEIKQDFSDMELALLNMQK